MTMFIAHALACDAWNAWSAPAPGALPLSYGGLAVWLARQDFPAICARGINGQTPLMRAARLGDDAVIEALLKYGVETQALDDDGNNALWFACLQGGPASVLRLLEAGTPIDHANDDGITCLMQAAAGGRLEILQMLLALGARTELRAPDGRNALEMAAAHGLQPPCPMFA